MKARHAPSAAGRADVYLAVVDVPDGEVLWCPPDSPPATNIAVPPATTTTTTATPIHTRIRDARAPVIGAAAVDGSERPLIGIVT
jgi:hypothetical protein